MSKATAAQPMSIANSTPYAVDLVSADLAAKYGDRSHVIACARVCADLKARAEVGFKTYGTYLQPANGRSQFVDMYQELLDCVKYARCHIYEHPDDHAMQQTYDKLLRIVIELGARDV